MVIIILLSCNKLLPVFIIMFIMSHYIVKHG